MIVGMTKKKGDRRTTPRRPLMIPLPWLELIKVLARERKQPMLWYVLDLVAEQAAQKGMSHPPMPWE
jgi:hypothetical protein